MKPGRILIPLLFALCFTGTLRAQHSVAREWNEVHLATIRKDFARPTHHARNLFHVTLAMYDAWAAFDPVAKPFLLGDTVGGFVCPFTGVPTPADIQAAREEAISYAAYRLLRWRFRNSPGAATSLPRMDSLMLVLGYDTSYHATDYANGTPADLGNYIYEQIKAFGLQDGSNEPNNYANQYYAPMNPSLKPQLPGNPDIIDPNRWQPLTLTIFIDQNGNIIPGSTPGFLSPEWGNVTPFSMTDSDKTVYTRNGNTYNVYNDPGAPPYMDTLTGGGTSEFYQWTFALVSAWSSHLDPSDSVMIDISPANIGNAHDYPTTFQDYPNFYDLENGGDNGTGYTINPKTGQPYAPQVVPRGDYTRVLAEFWADGPSSETPPGHWFTILNYVNDHPQFERRWGGRGPIVDALEWDVKAYFALGGSVHDAAICAWGIKGWYDYVRPISAIRYMADQGQSTDTSLANYSPQGIPLIPGFIEVIQPGEPMDTNGMYAGKIKIKAWKGPNYIINSATDVAGVDWILAEKWWPYQRPTFITPPFAGYISGHSTYSRTAAEVMTLLTGDEYFPGGMSEFHAPMNSYLVFEDGPSMDVTLQWAKYKDASDQCSLSRIWGGIHPPADDIPGRLLGMRLGPAAFNFAENLYDNVKPVAQSVTPSVETIAKANAGTAGFTLTVEFSETMDTTVTPVISFPVENPLAKTLTFNLSASGWTGWTTYEAKYDVADSSEILNDIDVRVSGTQDVVGNSMEPFDAVDNFNINTDAPVVISVTPSIALIADAQVGMASFSLTIEFNESMNSGSTPAITFPVENPANTLTFNATASNWLNETTFVADFNVADFELALNDIDVRVTGAENSAGNLQIEFNTGDVFSIDTKNPEVVSVTPSVDVITIADVGTASFTLAVEFDEDMDTSIPLPVDFPSEDPLINTLTFNSGVSNWTSTTTFEAKYDVANSTEVLADVDVQVSICKDIAGNLQSLYDGADKFSIDLGVGINPVKDGVIRIYPNPASEGSLLTVELKAVQSNTRLQLFSAQGRLMQSHSLNGNEQLAQLNMQGLAAGFYLLRISSENLNSTAPVQLVR